MRRTVVGAALLVVVAGCAGTTPDTAAPNPGAMMSSKVDVDTAELRAQKARIGIEDCPTSKHRPPADGALPDLTLPCLGGGPAVDLSTLRGPLVVNLLAQWCEPCREELPFYQRLHEEGAGKLQVLGIDYLDTQPAGALTLAEQTGVTFPLLADPQGQLRAPLRVRGLPGVVFVNADGRVTQVEYTVVRSYDDLTSLVREHLGITL